MSSDTGKQYGLILSRKKDAQIKVTKPSVFDSGSDSEEEVKSGRNVKNFTNAKPKLKVQMEIQKAIDEDPTVYEYDNVYDSMKEKKEAKISEATVDRKPKYIEKLLKAADKRKKEYERRVERKIQKEREEEGEKFADKESFVTTAYKKKMQELQEEEEKEKRMDAIEAMMDVTKQKDLSGFYRHLLNRETSKGEESTSIVNVKEEKLSSGEDDDKVKNSDVHQSGTSKHSTSQETTKDDSEKKARESLQQLRRNTNKSNNSKPPKTDTLDADSDFTSDSESSSSDSSEDDQRQPTKRVESQSKEEKQIRSPSPSVHKKRSNDKSSADRHPRRVEKERHPKMVEKKIEESESSASESDSETKKKNLEKNNVEPVVDDQDRLKILFTKRTVGEAFTAAQERYWQRKKLKTSGFAVTCA